jgi:hypothetical protein
MPRSKHYSPAIDRFPVSALYHQAKAKRVPMTVLTNELIEDGLKGTEGWTKAEEAMDLRETASQS